MSECTNGSFELGAMCFKGQRVLKRHRFRPEEIVDLRPAAPRGTIVAFWRDKPEYRWTLHVVEEVAEIRELIRRAGGETTLPKNE